MVGRDIGTVVLPEAPLKIYLDASAEERARRRYVEVQARGDQAQTYEAILDNVKQRDAIDSGRATAPLKAAPDAVIMTRPV
jgi:cytidylate kinase